jgi:hypothetical protein
MRRQSCEISGFCRYVNKICALLGSYAACNGKTIADISGQYIGPIFRDREIPPQKKTPEGGTDRVYRNIDKDLLLQTVQHPGRALISPTIFFLQIYVAVVKFKWEEVKCRQV